jgi:sulfite reductase alpha subunit-like flavoprotein
MARKVDAKLEEFGGKRIYKRGEGDDDSRYFVTASFSNRFSLEDDFAAWKKDLYPSLCEHFSMPIPADVSGDLYEISMKFR